MSPIYAKWLVVPLLANSVISSTILLTLHTYKALITPYITFEMNFYSVLMTFFIIQNVLVLPWLYWLDKSRSKRKDKERIPELVLHIFTIFGGFFGAFYGQKRFLHKTQKVSFKVSNGLGIAVIALIFYLLTNSL